MSAPQTPIKPAAARKAAAGGVIVEFRLWLATVLMGWVASVVPEHHPEGLRLLECIRDWIGDCIRG